MRCRLRRWVRGGLATLSLLGMSLGSGAVPASYDPLAKPGGVAIARQDLVVHDSGRDREIPVRVYLPGGTNAAPVVLFSHGLGGSREGCAYLGEHWAARGYVGVFLQHPGSDESVWRDQPIEGRMAAMREAASGKNFMLRVMDIPAVLDRLTEWNGSRGHPLRGRLDLGRVGMSGHSFGAVTTQAVSGQTFPVVGARFTDGRIRAAIAFSPSRPKRGDASAAFGSVGIPWLLMTGTRDIAVIGDTDVASRLAVFPALPAGDKYELVLFDAEHSAFADRALPGDKMGRNPNHHRAILALSTAFWDAYLRGDAGALAWLPGDEARTVLEDKDRWRLK